MRPELVWESIAGIRDAVFRPRGSDAATEFDRAVRRANETTDRLEIWDWDVSEEKVRGGEDIVFSE